MEMNWTSVCGLLAAVCLVQVVHSFYSERRCECNGRAQFCQLDATGLRCIECQGNTEGRHCERCKVGFYLQGAGLSCTPCNCNPTGSVRAACDSRGRCSCKYGVRGEKCDRCPDGPIRPDGCLRSQQKRENSGSLSLPCFCYGHSQQCSATRGYSIYNVTSTFSTGPEGWKAATVRGVTPDDVHFRWSPKHQDLEVISRVSPPIYLHAPEPFLGNQLLSYGQNLSFLLRLDRGVPHPSTNDVVLEGAGMRVSASLGDLRTVIPCGQKISYSFRLDEQLGATWRPQLSSFQFQSLLENLTAIMIRATFGENGRGYLDNVKLVSARHGEGIPARWVQTCSCPRGHEGEFCELCSDGFRRRVPANGVFSPCDPCSCRGGSCDPQTGDCYSADETPGEQSCSVGFYQDRQGTCVRCPCPDGTSCSLAAGSPEPRCDWCPPGAFGSRCDVCREGFYGDPAGASGVQRPCRPCSCNGHIDTSVVGSCDRRTGECLRCLNHTSGRSCESCLRGFYHQRLSDACKPCSCDAQGSESEQCEDSGLCRCRPGFQGLRCERSNCPSCFNPVKIKLDDYEAKLKDLENMFSRKNGAVKPSSGALMDATLRMFEELINNLQKKVEELTGMERSLQRQLSSISQNQLTQEQEVLNVDAATEDIRLQQQTWKTKVKDVQTLMDQMRRSLEDAKAQLRSVEFPLRDAPLTSDQLASLAQTATNLANEHQAKADAIEPTANEALDDAKKSLDLVQVLMDRENKVKDLTGDLKVLYTQLTSQVKTLENEAMNQSDKARVESGTADRMLNDISRIEQSFPPPLKMDVGTMALRLGGLENAVQENISAVEKLQDSVQQSQTSAEEQLAEGRAAQQEANKLLDRVNIAKSETEIALKSIQNNVDKLDDTLDSLRGFDQQIDDSKALSDAAIKRLPDINATIQAALSSNAKTQSTLDIVSKGHKNTLGTIDQLQNLINNLEGTLDSLPPPADVVTEATRLNKESKDLKTNLEGAAADTDSQLEDARHLNATAQEATAAATGALSKAFQTKEAVQKVLQDVNQLLASLNQSEVLDEKQVKQLEDSLASAEKEVEDHLRPRLHDMVQQEAAQRRLLTRINLDIDSIMADIANLQNINSTIPGGCFNSPPIEEA
ncbi:laminin subunit gamma-2 [Nothobranchius furzeri]|uniref:Laminin subunit gamma-2-like n=4 Tax=Nothobranchius TaxID=28779 RepID=A0A8C6LRQ9_NOTFU|nr:laminin subunit gamma-2-like [Nothobranchius furzeri]